MNNNINNPDFFPFYIMVKKRKWIFFSKLKFVKITNKEEYLKYNPENTRFEAIGSFLGIYKKK